LTHFAELLVLDSSSFDAGAEFTAMSSTDRKLAWEAQLLSQKLAMTKLAIKACNKEASRTVSAKRRNQRRARAILLLQDGRPDALQAFCNTLPDSGGAEQKDAMHFFECTSLPDLMMALQEVQTVPDTDYVFAKQFLEEWALGQWIQTLNEEHGIVPSSATIKHKMLEDRLEGETNKVVGSKKNLKMWAWRFRKKHQFRWAKLAAHSGGTVEQIRDKVRIRKPQKWFQHLQNEARFWGPEYGPHFRSSN
jgi:hypothetical protein